MRGDHPLRPAGQIRRSATLGDQLRNEAVRFRHALHFEGRRFDRGLDALEALLQRFERDGDAAFVPDSMSRRRNRRELTNAIVPNKSIQT